MSQTATDLQAELAHHRAVSTAVVQLAREHHQHLSELHARISDGYVITPDDLASIAARAAALLATATSAAHAAAPSPAIPVQAPILSRPLSELVPTTALLTDQVPLVEAPAADESVHDSTTKPRRR